MENNGCSAGPLERDVMPDLPPEGHPLRKLGARLAELLDENQFPEAERLIFAAWEEIQEADHVRERCADLLACTAVALKGPEKALHRHGWQDLPEAANALAADRGELLDAIEQLPNDVKGDPALEALLAIARRIEQGHNGQS